MYNTVYFWLYPNSAAAKKYARDERSRLINKFSSKTPKQFIHEPLSPDEIQELSSALNNVAIENKLKRLYHPNAVTNANLVDITCLHLQGCHIGNDGIKNMAFLEQGTLTTLNLSANSINDVGVQTLVKFLSNNNQLTTLLLQDNKIGDAGAQELAAFISIVPLATLDLSNSNKKHITARPNNFISNIGAEALANSLINNRSLSVLKLNNNNIGNAGAQALARCLINNRSLSVLKLSRNNIGDIGAEALAESLIKNSCLSVLKLQHNQIGNSGALAFMRMLLSNTTLKNLDLCHNMNITDEGQENLNLALIDKPKLSTLNIYNISTEVVDILSLTLAKTTEVTEVTELKLVANNKILRNFAQKKNLLQAIANSRLSTVKLHAFLYSEFQYLLVNSRLNTALRNLDLWLFCIKENDEKLVAAALKNNDTLSAFSLRTCVSRFMGDAGNKLALAVAEVLNTTKLKTLRLIDNDIGEAGAIALANAIKVNYTLKAVDLSDNSFNRYSRGSNACRALLGIANKRRKETEVLLPAWKIFRSAAITENAMQSKKMNKIEHLCDDVVNNIAKYLPITSQPLAITI